jgi:hypothetical protein
MKKAIFYHAGCAVCRAAQEGVIDKLNPAEYVVEIVDLSVSKNRVSEAEQAGVKSIPALVVEGQVFHINYGAGLADLKTPEPSELSEREAAEDLVIGYEPSCECE